MMVTLRPPAYAGIGPACRGPAASEDHGEIWALGLASGVPVARGLHQPASRWPLPVHRFTTCADPARRWARYRTCWEVREMATDNLPAIRVQAAAAAARLAPPTLAPAPEETSLDWRRCANALSRFKWVVLLTVALGTAAGVGATRFLSPEYVAQATVWIDLGDQRGAADRSGPLRPERLLDAESWVDLLKSYVVLDE